MWCVTTADNPGIRTIFTTKGVDYCEADLADSVAKPQTVI